MQLETGLRAIIKEFLKKIKGQERPFEPMSPPKWLILDSCASYQLNKTLAHTIDNKRKWANKKLAKSSSPRSPRRSIRECENVFCRASFFLYELLNFMETCVGDPNPIFLT